MAVIAFANPKGGAGKSTTTLVLATTLASQGAFGLNSGKLFRVPSRRGTFRYRIFMTVNQAGAGYLESWSGTQTVRRR